MGGNQPVGIARRGEENFGNRLAWNPNLHRAIIDGIANAPNAGVVAAGILPCANVRQIECRSCLEIAVENRHR